ncbi:MAG: DUF2274 domain-containing protein [Polaromonas sp.]|uniref:DUF2274 domain-containing protein n=1 Tax=Polaromonas sp. TaxID=1869339 RepID=UPI0017EDADCF|nr:DUF2274 domain-containing protein [Polaromonas sp.]NMM09160.1 DUF2274 domain-containing protein [Polaromonas sp.]
MSQSAGKLRLGPLPKVANVKVTIALTTTLKADLERYAALHAQTYGEPIDATTLIPHMLEAFMARDRGFKRAARPRTVATQRNEKAVPD